MINRPTKKLGEVCDVFADGDWIETKDQSSDGIRLIQTGNIGRGVFIGKENSRARFISEATFKRLNCTEVFPGDILISRLPDPVGRACVVPELETRTITAVDCTIVRPKTSEVFSEFLLQYLSSVEYFEQINSLLAGTTRKRISRGNLGKIAILLPSIAEQKKIVAKIEKQFAKIDEAVRLRAESEKLTAELLPASLHEIFGSTSLTTGSSAESKGWEIKMIAEVCDHPQYGFTASASQNPAGPKFLRITDIQDGKVDWSLVPYCVCKSVQKYQLKSSDLVFARTGATVGKSFLITDVPDQTVFASYLIRLRAGKTIIPEFLYYFFQSPDYWHQIGAGQTGMQPNMNGTKLAKIKIPLPPLAEQKKIVKKLDVLAEKIRALREAQGAQSAALKSLKQSILREAFSGKITA